MSDFQISVRELVEFILREGDIDNRGRGSVEQAMLLGARIHRRIQKRQGPDYRAEVPLSLTIDLGEYTLTVSGRADGIFHGGAADAGDGQLTLREYLDTRQAESEGDLWKNAPTVDEIKGTYADIDRFEEAKPLHLAQAKCYAYLLLKEEGLERIRVRITYCQMETEQIRFFHYRYQAEELSAFFDDLIARYRRFSDHLYSHRLKVLQSIRDASFPFPYRQGQKQLVGYVYRTIRAEKKLFLEAPTGAGKTLAVLYPALKAIGEERAERIFYMTAKTIARTAPEQAFSLLRDRGLVFTTVTLTAKEHACILEKPDCNPVSCPRAQGHYTRVNDAIYALVSENDRLDRDTILDCAAAHRVCPFELSLDLALFADGVICDLNYVFDPFVYLKRFFAEGNGSPCLFLTDEAHNLLERGRQMYSAELRENDLAAASEAFRDQGKGASGDKRIPDRFRSVLAELRELPVPAAKRKLTVLGSIEPLVQELTLLADLIAEYLSEEREEAAEEERDFYFRLFRFLTIAGFVDDHYLIHARREENGGLILKLFCVDPSERLRACADRAVSGILFSATFLPIQYYKSLLGGTPEDYEAYAETSFSPDRFRVFIAGDVTTRFKERGESQYRRMAWYLAETIAARRGKYLAFFPSYAMLLSVYRIFRQECYRPETMQILRQEEQMTEEGREAFLEYFTDGTEERLTDRIQTAIETEEEKSTLGFCILGGIFSEGIDLAGDRLIGVIIAGTGLPQVSEEQDLLRDYFDSRGQDGFDYAYRYPGMNKVLQAAGRLIRTERDAGVILLLDDRFLQPGYRALFPREWKNCKTVMTSTVKNELNAFWKGVC